MHCVQGKAVCLVLYQHLSEKDKLNSCLLDYALDIDGLQAAYPLTVFSVQEATAKALHPVLQWVQNQC